MTAEVFLSEYFSFNLNSYLQKAVRLYSQDAIDYSDFRMRMDVLNYPFSQKESYRLVYKVVFVAGPSIVYAMEE
ncbi:MAG: hypothetical protein IPN15_06425 [Saprospiraceae bacterium]|nr:hypothetical protein [Candidatus Vicinibacter affinis]